MSNRRVKSMSYGDDDAYDYEDYEDDQYDGTGDDGLSPEDREQLRLGTIKVREALGSAINATDAEIQEALWHYYYDVEKSVTFLKNKHAAPIPKENKKKPVSAPKDCAPKAPAISIRHVPNDDSDEHQAAANPFSRSKPVPAGEFFRDCPWFKIPAHRKSDILIEPLYPQFGLLGGSSKDGKMSKLAALAAKRRQKENAKPSGISTNVEALSEGNTARLKSLRLSVNERVPHDQVLPTSSTPELPEVAATDFTSPQSMNPIGLPSADFKNRHCYDDEEPQVVARLQAKPSAFATVITGTPAPEAHNLLSFLTPSNNSDTKSFDFTEPSPDDIVTKAQNAKATSASKAKKKDTAKTKTNLNKAVETLSIQDPVKVKYKNLDVATEYSKTKRKKAANFVVIGHVDAGKSTLMGRLLFDLKAVDQRTMDKYRKEAESIGKGSFAFAWVLDQGSEERARGVTIDIATNKFDTEQTSFTILDAPGHRDFVPNMIAGASQADFAVLVIDASTGNFESGLKGQTKEHALLARSIGVQRIIVAVNKMDMVDWSQERFQEIQQQISGFLTTAGFQPKNVAFVPCSGLEGGNILFKTTDTNASWCSGRTLVEELDLSEPTTHAMDKPLRMTIGDVFRGGVQNPLSVSGRLEAGNVQVGEQIVIMPSAEKAAVNRLEVDDEPLDWAVAGQNVVLHLTDIDPIHLKTGDVLCSPTSPIQNVTNFRAKILAFSHLTPMSVDIHRGRLHIPGRITQLVASLDKSTGAVAKKKPKIVQPGTVIRVVVELDQAVPLEAPGRIVLRAGGETVAAGLIE